MNESSPQSIHTRVPAVTETFQISNNNQTIFLKLVTICTSLLNEMTTLYSAANITDKQTNGEKIRNVSDKEIIPICTLMITIT